MKTLVIKCSKCNGPVWEEDIPDSRNKVIDLVCIICGGRWYYPKAKYLEWKRKRFGITGRI